MAKILIDEDFLDKLLQKSLPSEYEVLLDDDALTEEEQEYYYYLLLILNGEIEEVKKWLTSDEIKEMLSDIERLPLGFFDDFKIKMRVYLHDKFELLLMPLLLGYYVETNKNVYQSFNLEPTLSDSDLINFTAIKQYNYNLLSNLCDDLDNNFKDIILDGVINGKDVDEIAHDLEVAGISPLKRHTAQQRAKMIAKTEINNVKNQARLQAYRDNNILWVDIVTMGDTRVCSDCLSLEANNPYTIDEIDGLLPVHPNCRCVYAPSKKNYNYNTEFGEDLFN